MPEIVTVVAEGTADVEMGNVALTAPEGTVTCAGTETAAGLLLVNGTDMPAGAGPESVTVPVADVPPFTLAGLTATELSETVGAVAV